MENCDVQTIHAAVLLLLRIHPQNISPTPISPFIHASLFVVRGKP